MKNDVESLRPIEVALWLWGGRSVVGYFTGLMTAPREGQFWNSKGKTYRIRKVVHYIDPKKYSHRLDLLVDPVESPFISLEDAEKKLRKKLRSKRDL